MLQHDKEGIYEETFWKNKNRIFRKQYQKAKLIIISDIIFTLCFPKTKITFKATFGNTKSSSFRNSTKNVKIVQRNDKK